jgi:hypothetical protein
MALICTDLTDPFPASATDRGGSVSSVVSSVESVVQDSNAADPSTVL